MLAPSPSHILRVHATHVSIVAFSPDNERLYSCDLAGNVVVTSTRTLRSIAAWKTHNDGILSVQEWADNIVTHGRDNKLHIWTRILAQETVGDVASRVDLPVPTLRYSLDVNTLNFCRFSLLELPASTALPNTSSASAATNTALIAVPNLIESSLADIWELPSCSRQYAAIGKLEAPEIGMSSWEIDSGGHGRTKTGILMALHLFMRSDQLHLLSAYESGEVALRKYSCTKRRISVEGRGWECIWKVKQHNESVMAMAVSRDCRFALTVSADHIAARYMLDENDTGERFARFKTKQPGNAAIAIRGDGRICAIGGWDGKIRLFSTKSFKPLGTLSYHTKSCQALSFANANIIDGINEDDDDELVPGERQARTRWLAAGSQDNRLTIWGLVDFNMPVQNK